MPWRTVHVGWIWYLIYNWCMRTQLWLCCLQIMCGATEEAKILLQDVGSFLLFELESCYCISYQYRFYHLTLFSNVYMWNICMLHYCARCKLLALLLHVTEIIVQKLSIETNFPNWDILFSLLSHCMQVLELYLKIGPTTSICMLYRLPFQHYYITLAID